MTITKARCKSVTTTDAEPPYEQVRFQIGETSNDLLDITVHGRECGQFRPGKSYSIAIEEVTA